MLALLLIPSTVLAATEGHGEGGIPSSVYYAALNFFILVAILVYFLRKPTKEFFASRATLIRQQISQAQELKEQADKRFADLEQRLQGVEAEGKKLVQELKHDGELEQRRMVQSAQDQAAAMKALSEKVMVQELRKAKEELKREAVALAAEMAEKLIRDNVSAQDQNRLVDDYLNKMERLP